MSRQRVGDLVAAAALVGVLATLAGGIAQASQGFVGRGAEALGVGELRLRLLLFTQVLGPTPGALVLLAAVASLLRRHRLLATAAFAVAVVVTVAAAAGVANDAALGYAPARARAGAALSLGAVLPLSLAAAWLAWSAQAVADPTGEAPDGRLGGGDGVGEPELDGLG